MKTKTLGLAAALLLLGCGGGGGGGTPVAFDSYPAELSTSFCAKTFECCTTAEIMEEYSLFGGLADEADCVTKFTPFLGGESAAFEASIAAGKMTYSESLAGDCLAAFSTASCSTYGSDDAPDGSCDRIFEGLVANDASCDFDEECVTQYCEGDDSDNNVAGTCKALPAIGSECPDFECAQGAYCEFGSPSMCIAIKADGESCSGDEQCINSCNVANDVGTCGAQTVCTGM